MPHHRHLSWCSILLIRSDYKAVTWAWLGSLGSVFWVCGLQIELRSTLCLSTARPSLKAKQLLQEAFFVLYD